jgi:arachidonate 15-lipoxygenase
VFKFKSYKPVPVPLPAEEPQLSEVQLAKRYKDVAVRDISVADHIPSDEAERGRTRLYKVQAVITRLFSPMGKGLPPIDADQQTALDTAYTDRYRKRFRAPVLPDELSAGADIGAIAVNGPYTGLLRRDADGAYAWDLGELTGHEPHAGLRELGTTVRFEPAGDTLRAVEIDCDLGVCHPGDADWTEAQRIALCAATTSTTLEHHFSWIHYTANAQIALSTRNALPPQHAVRRLLWPHMHRSQFTIDIVTKGQLVKGGDLENVFTYTHSGVCDLLDEAARKFDIRTIDPERDAERRGLGGDGVTLPPLDNRLAHFHVFHAHAKRYLDVYYPTDSALAADEHVAAWAAELHATLPHGFTDAVDVTTVAGLARFVGSFIHLAAVEHQIVGAGLWDYQPWAQSHPARVYADRSRPPLDVYQRLVNYNFLLNVPRTPLLQDFSYLGIDEPGKAAFRTFFDDLQRLQTTLDAEPTAPWKVSPKHLESHINI